MKRKTFLTILGGLIVGASVKAQKYKVDGGLAAITRKQIPQRSRAVRPAGSISERNFVSHCTACQLCVSQCPTRILKPSTRLENWMQPELQYDEGYCMITCNRCSQVCPTGAINPIAKEEKAVIQIGHARWIAANCVVGTDHVTCDNCAEHCPTGAIQMIDGTQQGYSYPIPAIDESRCIGCGKCEYLCPARPFSAIVVDGLDTQITQI